jgi:hypothetical protein
VWPASYWGVNSGQVYQYVQYDQDGGPKAEEHVEHEQHSEEAHALQTMHQQVDSHDKIDGLDAKQQVRVISELY